MTKTWKVTFVDGSTQTVRAEDYRGARSKVLSGLHAYALPKIYSVVLVTHRLSDQAKAIAAFARISARTARG